MKNKTAIVTNRIGRSRIRRGNGTHGIYFGKVIELTGAEGGLVVSGSETPCEEADTAT